MKYSKKIVPVLLVLFGFLLRFFTNFYTFSFSFSYFFPAIASGFTIFITFLLARKIFDYEIGIIAGFLFAISPWHIALSYQSFEAILFVLSLTTAIYSKISNRRLIFLLSMIIIFIFSGLIFMEYQTINEISHEQHKTVIRQIVSGGQGNILIIRLFHNKFFETIRFSLQRLSMYFEPQGFFLTGSYFFGKRIIGSGSVLTVVFPLFLAGLVQIVRRTHKAVWLLAWIFLSALPGIISIHVQHSVLGSGMIPALSIISALALASILRRFLYVGILVLFLTSLNFIFSFSQYISLL